jgi:hypothetical protein
MDPATHDVQLRQAAFDHVNRLGTLRGGILDSSDLAGGFEFGGERIPLINPRRGIFKRPTENELSDFSGLWHDGCGEAIIEAQDVDRNHSTEV